MYRPRAVPENQTTKGQQDCAFRNFLSKKTQGRKQKTMGLVPNK